MRPRFPGGTTPGFPGGIETVVTLRLWGVGQQCPPAVAGPHGHHGWLHRARGVISGEAPVKDWGHCVLGSGCVVSSPSDQAHGNLDKDCGDGNITQYTVRAHSNLDTKIAATLPNKGSITSNLFHGLVTNKF